MLRLLPILGMALVGLVLLTGCEGEEATTATATPTAAVVTTPEATPSPEATPGTTRTPTPVEALPVFEVTAAGVSAESAAVVAEALDLPVDPQVYDGSLFFIDPERFQRVPTTPLDGVFGEDEDGLPTVAEAFDFDALREMPVYSEEDARARVADALSLAELLPDGAEAWIGHAMFEAVGVMEGEEVIEVPIDTQVNYNLELNGLPLLGPGAKVKAAFDGEGVVTLLRYALREVSEGQSVEVISPEEAIDRCAGGWQEPQEERAGDVQLQTRLVYYAPPLDMQSVSRIFPYYECSGTTTVDGEDVALLNTFIPAIEDVPRVELLASVERNLVSAEARVSGGTAPYSYQWSSSNVSLDPEVATAGPTIEYEVFSREPAELITETVSLVVTDADGLTGSVSEAVEVTLVIPETTSRETVEAVSARAATTTVDVGTEWVGKCDKKPLPNASANGNGFAKFFKASGIPVRFNWGEKNAWEKDFKDPIWFGDDSNWVDNVDAVFFEGHGTGNGFQFCSWQHDKRLNRREARWGNRDLEWLALLSCNVLEGKTLTWRPAWPWPIPVKLSWDKRWGPAFKGLHLLMGFATIAYDEPDVGEKYAQAMLGRLAGNMGPFPVGMSWALAAILTQPSSVLYSYMGPYGPKGQTNMIDYFWGQGKTTSDIDNPKKFWRVESPS